MQKDSSLSELYSLRKDFTIIALTGRTGSGCTTVAKLIEKGFDKIDYPNPFEESKFIDLSINSFKKYSIIYKFAEQNFKPYTLISYLKILTLLLLKHNCKAFIEFLGSIELKKYIEDYNSNVEEIEKIDDNFEEEISKISNDKTLFSNFDRLSRIVDTFDFHDFNKAEFSLELFDLYFDNEDFKKLYSNLHFILTADKAKHNILFQVISNNIRKSGSPYNFETNETKNIFTIIETINALIKSIRYINAIPTVKKPSKIILDSLQNPYEVMYLKQRYSAFYLMAVNKDEQLRIDDIKKKYPRDFDKINKLLELEYVGGKGKNYYRQYVRECIEKADIHISYRKKDEIIPKNKRQVETPNDKTSPFFTWEMQVIKYLSLIEHPGLVTPSPEERSMQLAYTAKYNSGCISRQVGAAITDENYSIKAIGWNNTPEGQVPCSLRDSEVLISHHRKHSLNTIYQIKQLESFTPYELSDEKFKDVLCGEFESKFREKSDTLNGRNLCFCFKTLHNACYDGKNQVQTRSLHAEESAFLQITKYGGNGIQGGKLFTTASPCELCSKKAYQLGIKVIYYIDPYPGISEKQILKTGSVSNRPIIRIFNGAIGNAYHWLYEPLISYKDELALLLDLDIKDLANQQSDEIKKLKEEKAKLELEKIDLLKKIEMHKST